ncbi:helix-turn-helix domain-containing protein [Aliiroseovarius marinus]|uniref:helix-turn-helix domain-containing protein n=1 Tax=Aliiroseovarius marinus TaxID=2500159 RepID=UPI003D7CE54F
MTYVDTLRPKPHLEAVTGYDRPTRHGVTLIVPDGAPAVSAQIIADLFRAANDLIQNARYDLRICTLADWPGGDPALWQRQTVVFLGNIHDRWLAERKHWQRAQQVMNLSRQVVLVGGAVFLLCGSGHEEDLPLAIHPNFALAAQEEGLRSAGHHRLTTQDTRLHSAISPLVAVKLILTLIADSHGAFVATALAAYVGLDDSPEKPRSPLAHDLRRRAGGDVVVSSTLDLMERHMETPWSIHDLSAQQEVSQRQLQRRFMAVLGQTPLEIYRLLRVEKARELLTHTSLPLPEIALATGFAASGHLTKCFKQVYKITPRDLRREAFRLAS